MTTYTPEIPIISHPDLPDSVPLIADFHDMRNRLSYYFPLLRDMDVVTVPQTRFFAVTGSSDTFFDINCRDITQFLQTHQLQTAFIRGDYSSGKYNGDVGSKLTSHDPYDIECTIRDLFNQLGLSKRRLGSRIAVREWIPHEREVRFFLRDGAVYYADSVTESPATDWPWKTAESIAQEFSTYAWSCDFIQHTYSEQWYCIDMGLDGFYYDPHTGWVSISEHIQHERGFQHLDEDMPDPTVFL